MLNKKVLDEDFEDSEILNTTDTTLDEELILLENELDEKCIIDEGDFADTENFDSFDEEDVESIDEEEKIISRIDQDDSESELDVYFKYNTNNHKLDGKHSLKRDTILNGKLNPKLEDDSDLTSTNNYDSSGNFDFDSEGEFDSFKIETGSVFEDDSRRADDMLNKRRLSEDVYNLLQKNTDLDFTVNRRKPNKMAFNNYYKMVLDNVNKQYTKSEIFVELSYYFTDNIFNMYKLLDKKYATDIIMELKEKGHLNNLDSITFM